MSQSYWKQQQQEVIAMGHSKDTPSSCTQQQLGEETETERADQSLGGKGG